MKFAHLKDILKYINLETVGVGMSAKYILIRTMSFYTALILVASLCLVSIALLRLIFVIKDDIQSISSAKLNIYLRHWNKLSKPNQDSLLLRSLSN